MNGNWTINETEDGQWYHVNFATREEAVEAAKEYLCEDEPIMYVGRCYTVRLPHYIDIDDIFETLNNQYAKECFEYEDYLFEGVDTEGREWLEGKLSALMAEFYERAGIKSTQFLVGSIEEIKMPKAVSE